MSGSITENTAFKLFVAFLRIGAFTFGGGYAMLPLIKRDLVEKHKWLDEDEFLDAITVAQSVPGAIAINTAIYSGYKIKGLLGAFISLLGVILPSFFIILFIAIFLLRWQDMAMVERAFMGIRPGVVGLIFAAVLSIGKPVLKTTKTIAIFLVAFVMASFGIHPFLIIFLFGCVAIILYKKANKQKETKKHERT